MRNNEKFGKLAVGTEGDLIKTNEVDINKLTTLAEVKGKVMKDRIVIQLLPAKESKINGIILPTAQGELRAAVVCTHESSEFKRGEIILLKSSDFPYGAPEVTFVEGNPCAIVYESFIWYKYDERIDS
jgi:hypothetical protein